VKQGALWRWSKFVTALRAAAGERRVVLLVLRWRRTARKGAQTKAFARAASRVMREGDILARDPVTGSFAVAMLAFARDGSTSHIADARAALERIAAAMAMGVNDRMETGWWSLAGAQDVDALAATIERAFERGSRERERLEFLATIGHELRTPLTSIRGYVETLLDETVDAATARRFLEVVRSETLRLGRLVDGMLEFSLLDLASDVRSGISDLGEVIRAAVAAIAPVAAQAGVSVTAAVECDAYARVSVDACMHALLNLVENGVKYGRSSGMVLVRLERQDAYNSIFVDDDGQGIDPRERERIFERRARGSRSSDRGGSGIGLSIVRTIVERAGGSVCATDSPLGGARFWIKLPAMVDAKADSERAPS
jgi:signal transduction histidine kinase